MLLNWLNRKSIKAEDRECWETYRKANASPVPRHTPIEEVRFVVFDTETTGLDVRNDQILSIGAVMVRGGRICLDQVLEIFVHQVYEPVKASVEVHGILPVDREGSLEEKEAIRRFLEYIGNGVLIGHHVGFDIAMINAVLRERVGEKLLNPYVDTLQLAKRLAPPALHPRTGEFTLDYLCRKYGIPLNDRHTAAGDAFLTALLFLKMSYQLEKRGVRTLRDLLRRRIPCGRKWEG